MINIAKVDLISVHVSAVYLWLRKELLMNPVEAKEKAKSGSTIDFDGDIKKAIEFYEYIQREPTSSARLIIDVSFDTRGFVGAHGILNIDLLYEENEKYLKELES